MKKLLLVLFVALATQLQAQPNFCDSIEISMNCPPNSFAEFSVNLSSLGFSAVTYDWILTDESGNVINSSTAANAIFSLPNAINSDTNYICLTSTFSTPAMTFACINCDTIVWNGTNWVLLSMMPPPCNLTGGSVYIDYTSGPWMMNATVNGMSTYDYSWTDTNGIVVSTANQTPFYTQWCVSITDNMTGCDTTICQDCTPSNAICGCIMLYMPVCGCDGVMYSNSCLADCADVPWTPAISNGMPGGFLPCTTNPPPLPCIVDINNGTVDIEICDGDTAILEATTGFDTYLWTLASTGAALGTTHIIEVTDPGLYIVIVTDSTNCVDMDSIEVIVYPETPLNPMTAPNPPMVCLGDSVVIEVNSGFLNYWWNTGNPLDQDEDRVVIFPTQDFTYYVEALDANGCESREGIEVFVDTCATGIINIMSAQVFIYPNPAKGIMTINLPKSEVFDLVIFDVMGRLVLSENKVAQTYIIPDNTLANGSYILNLSHDKGVITKKLLIE